MDAKTKTKAPRLRRRRRGQGGLHRHRGRVPPRARGGHRAALRHGPGRGAGQRESFCFGLISFCFCFAILRRFFFPRRSHARSLPPTHKKPTKTNKTGRRRARLLPRAPVRPPRQPCGQDGRGAVPPPGHRLCLVSERKKQERERRKKKRCRRRISPTPVRPCSPPSAGSRPGKQHPPIPSNYAHKTNKSPNNQPNQIKSKKTQKSALFRTDFVGRGELAERQQKLGQFLAALKRLAETYGVAVVMTNQVMSTPEGGMTCEFLCLFGFAFCFFWRRRREKKTCRRAVYLVRKPNHSQSALTNVDQHQYNQTRQIRQTPKQSSPTRASQSAGTCSRMRPPRASTCARARGSSAWPRWCSTRAWGRGRRRSRCRKRAWWSTTTKESTDVFLSF